MKIDSEALEDYGLLLLKLKIFPYFDIANYILMCLAVREDINLHQTCNYLKIFNHSFEIILSI